MERMMNWTIRTKLFLLTAILILGLFIFALITYFLVETIKIKGPYYEQILESNYLIANILPPPGYIIEFYLLANLEMDETNPAKLEALIKRSEKTREEYYETHEKWSKLLPEGKIRNLFVNQSHVFVKDLFEIWENRFIPAVLKNDRPAAAEALADIGRKYQEHRNIIDEVVRLARARHVELEKEVTTIYNRNQRLAIFAWLATFSIGILLAYLIARSINNPLRTIVSGLSHIFDEISNRVDQQSKAVVQQSSAVNQTTATMDEFNTSFQHTEGLAKESSNRAKAVLQIADTGNNLLKQVIGSLSTHREKVAAIVDQIMRLSELIRQIHNIAAVTSNLTNQTNILALNAAVQAAHVKHQSEGFSVIASEIRKLADESKKFLSHIDVLVDNIQQATDATVKIAEEGNKTVQEIIVKTQDTASAFDSLISITNKSFEGAEQAAANVNQQGIAVHQVLEAMENLNQVAHQTMVGMQQIRGELNNLQAITQELKDII
jgi:methyl-accepting chemotaxis protein